MSELDWPKVLSLIAHLIVLIASIKLIQLANVPPKNGTLSNIFSPEERENRKENLDGRFVALTLVGLATFIITATMLIVRF